MKSIRGHSIGLKFTSSLWIRLLLLLHAANSCGHEAAAAAAAAATGFFFKRKNIICKKYAVHEAAAKRPNGISGELLMRS